MNHGEITKAQYDAYVRMQEEGTTNMFDLRRVCELTDLDPAEVRYIVANYSMLTKHFYPNRE